MKREFVMIKTWHTEEDEPILISDHASQEAMDQAGNDYFEKTGDRNVSVLAMYGSDSKEEIMDIENLGQDELVRAKEWKGKTWYFSLCAVTYSPETGCMTTVFPLNTEEKESLADWPIRVNDIVKDRYYH